MAATAPPTVQAFLDAADAMYKGTSDETARRNANAWLQDFQKTVSRGSRICMRL